MEIFVHFLIVIFATIFVINGNEINDDDGCGKLKCVCHRMMYPYCDKETKFVFHNKCIADCHKEKCAKGIKKGHAISIF
jgi:hypothetical protein